MRIFFSILFALAVVGAIATPAYAGPFTGSVEKLTDAVDGTGLESNLEKSVGTVIKAILAVVGTIFFVLTIYAGILWMTAAGNEEQVTTATSIIKTTVIGLFITMSAYSITAFVASKVEGGAGGSAGGGGPVPADGFTEAQCKAQGGYCDFSKNVGVDCDPPNYDSYNRETPGACQPDGQNKRTCCILVDSEEKCGASAVGNGKSATKGTGWTCASSCGSETLLGGQPSVSAGFFCERVPPRDECCLAR